MFTGVPTVERKTLVKTRPELIKIPSLLIFICTSHYTDDDSVTGTGGGHSAQNGDNGDKLGTPGSLHYPQLLNSDASAISSVETLLMNIQGLLKVAAENARHRERQINYEKGKRRATSWYGDGE